MAITLYYYCLSRMAQIRSVLLLGDDLDQVCTAVLISLVLQFNAIVDRFSWFMDPPMNLHFPSHCGRPVCLWPCRALWPLVVVWGRSSRRSECATYAEEMCSFCLLQVLIQSLVGDFLKCSVFKAFSLFPKLIKSVIKPLLTSRCCELKTGSSGNQLTSLLEPFQIYVLHWFGWLQLV